MIHALTPEWEHNGYHDSDWYCIAYDDEKDRVFKLETHSTRFAGGYPGMPAIVEPESEVYKAATNNVINGALLGRIKEAHYTVNHNNVKAGETLVVKTRFSVGVRDKCEKCNGSGKWVNPKRGGDIRQCFGCKGTGYSIYASKTGARVSVKAGMSGMVTNVTSELDKFNRTSHDKHFAWLSIVGLEGLIKCNINSLTRPEKTDAEFLTQAQEFVRAHGSARAFYWCFE